MLRYGGNGRNVRAWDHNKCALIAIAYNPATACINKMPTYKLAEGTKSIGMGNKAGCTCSQSQICRYSPEWLQFYPHKMHCVYQQISIGHSKCCDMQFAHRTVGAWASVALYQTSHGSSLAEVQVTETKRSANEPISASASALARAHSRVSPAVDTVVTRFWIA